MEMRKGFVYTLEAVIASSIILTMVLVVLPETGPETDPDFSTVESGLETLEENGSFEQNLTNSLVEDRIDPYIPNGYNYSSRIYKSENLFKTVNPPEEIYHNGSGSSADIQFWIDSPSDLNVTFQGEEILTGIESPGYYERPLPGTEGWLNFTGTGTVEYSFKTYHALGESPEHDKVYSENILTYHEGSREVQIYLWR